MAAPKFTLTYLDGTSEEVVLRPRAQIAYEEDTGEGLASLDEDIRVSKLYRLAWYAAGRPSDFDEWIDSLESVDLPAGDMNDDGEADTRPT